MKAVNLNRAATNFTLWGDLIHSGMTVEPADLVEQIRSMQTAVFPDNLRSFPEDMGDYLSKALQGDFRAASEFAETLNGYVTIASRNDGNGMTSVMVVGENSGITTLCQGQTDCEAMVIVSLHHLGERCRKMACELEDQVHMHICDEPEM